jgi:hypothetical protein
MPALLARLQEERKRRQSRTKLLGYEPYTKQAAFHAAGAAHRERLLMAANQCGKTYCGACEAAFHLTGVGEPKDEAQWGTGLIPGDDLVGWGRRQVRW